MSWAVMSMYPLVGPASVEPRKYRKRPPASKAGLEISAMPSVTRVEARVSNE